jgi:hypothetical protein
MEIGLLEGFIAIWNVATATGPSAITPLLNPNMRQLSTEQERDFAASVVDVPGTTVTPAISEEKPKDHWSATACAPPVDVRLIGIVTVPPGVPYPDASERVTLWPKAIVLNPIKPRKPIWRYKNCLTNTRIGLVSANVKGIRY